MFLFLTRYSQTEPDLSFNGGRRTKVSELVIWFGIPSFMQEILNQNCLLARTTINVNIRFMSLDARGKNRECFAVCFLLNVHDRFNSIHRVLEEGVLWPVSRTQSSLEFHVLSENLQTKDSA